MQQHAHARAQAPAYERHRPEETALYRALQSHWRSFRADLDRDPEHSALPAFVAAEIDAYLRCGILAHGFVRARCGDCGASRVVA